jgi:stress response protein YsnF
MAKKAHNEAAETILVVEERAVVGKRSRITGAVHVRTSVREEEQLIDRPVTAEELSVERVPVDRWVEAPVEVRQEDDVTIIPIHAEVVVETRLKLVEEVRVRRRQTTTQAQERVLLRSEEAVVERLAAADDAR